MDTFGGFKETVETRDTAKEQPLRISTEANEKFDLIMQDETRQDTHQECIEDGEKSVFIDPVTKFLNIITEKNAAQEVREPNSTYECDGNTFATDDNGKTYKKDGELLPNTEYTVNGNRYKTDESGHPISCDSNPVYTDDGSRNIKEQKESGGEERLDDDDGGHIIAKILGGAEGTENLVPMRRTINRGDYKKMENEIARALQEGKQVTIHIDLTYNGNSQRPSKIHAEYIIEGKKTVVEFDNNENSTALLDTLVDKIEDDDFNSLKAEIEDMANEGISSSVTSVKTEYDESGNPVSVIVGLLDESTGEKTYKCFYPRKE